MIKTKNFNWKINFCNYFTKNYKFLFMKMIHYDHQEYLKRQITTLKVFNDNVTEIRENEVYSVGFNSGNNQLKIFVYFDQSQPTEKPNLLISPTIDHHWVNRNNGEIFGAPGLLNYTIHSEIGGVVCAIIREFEKNPVTVIENTSANNRLSPSTFVHSIPQSQQKRNSPLELSTTNSNSNSSGANGGDDADDNDDIKITDLSSLPLEELQKILQDPQYLDDLVDESDPMLEYTDQLNSILTEVKDLAENNVSCEQRLIDLKATVSEKLTTFRQLGDKYEATNRRYQEKAEEFAPNHIKELLAIAVSTADSDCDKHIDQFLHGQIEVQTFLDRYMKAKKLCALRKAKEERLTHQLKELERAAF